MYMHMYEIVMHIYTHTVTLDDIPPGCHIWPTRALGSCDRAVAKRGKLCEYRAKQLFRPDSGVYVCMYVCVFMHVCMYIKHACLATVCKLI
jgi:hypothetical protein